LARISLSKTISQEIEKIKADPKIDGWKTIFIQYKARCEKRKNWKDKLSKVKEAKDLVNTDDMVMLELCTIHHVISYPGFISICQVKNNIEKATQPRIEVKPWMLALETDPQSFHYIP